MSYCSVRLSISRSDMPSLVLTTKNSYLVSCMMITNTSLSWYKGLSSLMFTVPLTIVGRITYFPLVRGKSVWAVRVPIYVSASKAFV